MESYSKLMPSNTVDLMLQSVVPYILGWVFVKKPSQSQILSHLKSVEIRKTVPLSIVD